MAGELRDCPQGDFDRFNTGLTDESAPNAHIPLPGVSIWEIRKEEYHQAYMDELGKKIGMNLDLNIYDLGNLSRSDKKKITTAHHGKMQLAATRLEAAQTDVLSRMLNEGRRFRRHPIADNWEKVSCFLGADEYLFFRLPNALEGHTVPFWGFYFICHSDADHMDGHHVLMTGMENRLSGLGYSRLCWSVATFRVDLDLAEMLMQRINKLEAQLKVPLGQSRHMQLELKLSDLVGEMQELLESAAREGVHCETVDRLTASMGSFVRELNQVLNGLKPKPAS